jgi:hypothetical protein
MANPKDEDPAIQAAEKRAAEAAADCDDERRQRMMVEG